MNLKLNKTSIVNKQSVVVSGSKSEANRLLLLQKLYPKITIENLSNSDDTQLMQNALSSNKKIVDIHHAGTAMRFLTAYCALNNEDEIILTGSSRMKERPIKILVEALRELGAKIDYLENEGFPPLKIKGQKITKNKVHLQANVSSQYISALLLNAPKLKNGLKLYLEGKITSLPYIQMTLALLEEVGVKTTFKDDVIQIENKPEIKAQQLVVESDWSSASYFYSIVALSEVNTEITLSSYKKESLQGDSVLAEIYKQFGVETTFFENTIQLKKVSEETKKHLELDLNKAPDIAQTIAVTVFGLGLSCELLGLHTLKIKETDRLEALKTELEKLGAKIYITNNSLKLEASKTIISNQEIETYKDHRMAMAFAPLALKTNLVIQESRVVSKSYPNFWKDLEKIGFKISEE